MEEEVIKAYVTPVYPHEENFRFAVQGPGLDNGYEFNDRVKARRGRALLIKQLKSEGMKVICVRLH